MSKYKALVFWGGWEGHEPKQVGEIFRRELAAKGFDVTVTDTLDTLKDLEFLKSLNVIVPCWTMGQISGEQCGPLCEAVRGGVGIAGCHGGMCDSFRSDSEYQFMTGGQFVAHPGGPVDYTVAVTDPDHFITRAAPPVIKVTSEQYYMHVDPANRVLATTRFPTADGPHIKNGPVEMPVIWTKYYGEGRVAYNSLGHDAATVGRADILPTMVRGVLWAAHAEDAA